MLALPPADPTLNEIGGSQILCPTISYSKPIEQAGLGYEVLRRRIHMAVNQAPLEEDEEEKVDPTQTSTTSQSQKSRSPNKRRKKGRRYSSSSESEDEELTKEDRERFNAIMEKKKKQ